jgi:hypothetical protein
MKFTSNKQRVVLRGVSNEVTKCSQISGHKLKGLIRKKVVTHMLALHVVCPLEQKEEVSQSLSQSVCSISSEGSLVNDGSNGTDQKLLQQYDHLFHEPKTLPPRDAMITKFL